jgi:hypothetical protein
MQQTYRMRTFLFVYHLLWGVGALISFLSALGAPEPVSISLGHVAYVLFGVTSLAVAAGFLLKLPRKATLYAASLILNLYIIIGFILIEVMQYREYGFIGLFELCLILFSVTIAGRLLKILLSQEERVTGTPSGERR